MKNNRPKDFVLDYTNGVFDEELAPQTITFGELVELLYKATEKYSEYEYLDDIMFNDMRCDIFTELYLYASHKRYGNKKKKG